MPEQQRQKESNPWNTPTNLFNRVAVIRRQLEITESVTQHVAYIMNIWDLACKRATPAAIATDLDAAVHECLTTLKSRWKNTLPPQYIE